MGRVDLGGRPPRPPTDPDVHVKRIWLFCHEFATPLRRPWTAQGSGKTVPLLQADELLHMTISVRTCILGRD